MLDRNKNGKGALDDEEAELLSARQPYVAVFCGVNGVGKSTSLAKVAFMLKEGGCRVLIAACDSFRSGAVEQLKKHTAALGVELYEQG